LAALVAVMVAIGRVGYYSFASISEGNTLLADSTAQAVLASISDGRYLSVDPDKIARLSELYEVKNPEEYRLYKDLRDGLRLRDREFYLQGSPGLQVKYTIDRDRLRVTVAKPFSEVGVAAGIRVYVFDGSTVVSTLVGESNIQGNAIFQVPQQSGRLILIFARSGSSTGFNATTAEGWGSMLVTINTYVKGGSIVNPPPQFHIFSYSDWKGPLTQPNLSVDGYPLPILIVWKSEGYFCHLPYPHLPEDYGPESPLAGVTTTYLVKIVDSTFQLRFKIWGSGGGQASG